MAHDDSFRQWLADRIESIFTKGSTDSRLIIWCDPNREWLSLLQAGLKPKSVELWGNPEEGELSLRDRFLSAAKSRRIIWLPRSRRDTTWLKVFELEADGVWEKSLVEALREYGVAISRDGENELAGLLAAQALAWLDQPMSVWKELSSRVVKGTLVTDQRILEVLSAGQGQFEKLKEENQFEVFARRATEDFGFPDPHGMDEASWRVASAARLLATEAVAANAQNPPSEGEHVIPPGVQRENALKLLQTWQRDIHLLPSFETVSMEADKRLSLPYWARNLASPPRSYASRAVEEACFQICATRLDGMEDLEPLCRELEASAQQFHDRANGFWEKTATRKVGWRYLLMFSQSASLFLEHADVEQHWKTVAEAVSWYTERGWLIDQKGETLYMESADMPAVLQRIRARVRRAYQKRVDAVGRAFSDLLSQDGEALSSFPSAGEIVRELLEQETIPTAFLIVDACSFQLGRRLADLVNEGEPVERAKVSAAVAPVPTITEIGKAFALPLAREELKVTFNSEKGSFAVSTRETKANLAVAEDRRKWLAARFDAKLFLSITEVLEGGKIEKAGKNRRFIVVEGDEFDTEGHEGLLKIAGAEEHLERYARAIRKLRAAGYGRIIVATDHGFFHWQSEAEEVEEARPEGEILWSSRRAIVGRQLRHKSAIHLSVPCSDLEALVPRSTNAFRAYGGLGYFHGGATLQELVIPVVCASWPQKVEKIPVVLRPVEQIVSLSQSIEVSPGYGELLDALDETRLPRHVEIKVMDTATGMLVFRSEQAATVKPGGENVVLKLRRIPEAKASLGQKIELRLIDVDNEEILERKEVTLKVDLDEWF
jgi:hypothetical protein